MTALHELEGMLTRRASKCAQLEAEITQQRREANEKHETLERLLAQKQQVIARLENNKILYNL